MAKIERIPILLLTGFLGSGKTTLLRALLNAEDATDTAVIVNEFGEIGLDHNLLLGATESTFVLENGCVCCSVRDDLEGSLEELFWQRLRREIPRFNRLVIETTGLADPYRVVDIVADHSLAAERYEWAAIAATVDGLNGLATIDHHIESVSQATIADHLIITKTDLAAPDDLAALDERLRLLNPTAAIHRAAQGELGAPLAELMIPAGETLEARKARQPELGVAEAHLSDIASCWLQFSQPRPRELLDDVRSDLDRKYGRQIIRIKGLVEFVGADDLAVVQEVAGGPLEIEAGAFTKSETRNSGLVVIASGVPEAALINWFATSGLAPLLKTDVPHEHDHAGHAHLHR